MTPEERRLIKKAIRKAERRVGWGMVKPENAEAWAARYIRRHKDDGK